jgi:hypothetical protein
MPPSIALDATYKEGYVENDEKFSRLVESFGNLSAMIIDVTDKSGTVSDLHGKMREKFHPNGGRAVYPMFISFDLDSKPYLILFEEQGTTAKGKGKYYTHEDVWAMVMRAYPNAALTDAGLCIINTFVIGLMGRSREKSIYQAVDLHPKAREDISSHLGISFEHSR